MAKFSKLSQSLTNAKISKTILLPHPARGYKGLVKSKFYYQQTLKNPVNQTIYRVLNQTFLASVFVKVKAELGEV
ncbi:hypothetical protein JCM30760_17820 [Thiomicrorhabdus hydrogeniphila]